MTVLPRRIHGRLPVFVVLSPFSWDTLQTLSFVVLFLKVIVHLGFVWCFFLTKLREAPQHNTAQVLLRSSWVSPLQAHVARWCPQGFLPDSISPCGDGGHWPVRACCSVTEPTALSTDAWVPSVSRALHHACP